MSRTTNIGILDAKYYLTAASEMESALRGFIEARHVNPEAMSVHVLRMAKRLINSAFAVSVDEALASDPFDNVGSYALFSGTVQMSWKEERECTPDEVRSLLKGFNDFMSDIETLHEMSEDEISVARRLQEFFEALKGRGNAQGYAEAMGGCSLEFSRF